LALTDHIKLTFDREEEEMDEVADPDIQDENVNQQIILKQIIQNQKFRAILNL